MKSFALILLSFFALGLWSAEVDLSKVKMGEKAEKVVTDMNAAIQKLNQDYLDATEKIKADAIKGLERERSRTKDGLVGMVIQHQINLIGEMKPPVDFLGRVIPKAPNPTDIVGTWVAANSQWSGVWIFNENGTMTENGLSGTYKFDEPNKVSVHVNGIVNVVYGPFNVSKVDGTTFNGMPLTMTRK